MQVGVKALIQNDQEQYLLLQRAEKLADGTGIKWDIPGGRIKDGESTTDGLAREILEETGLLLLPKPILLQVQDIFVGSQLHVVRLTYRVDATGQLKLSEQHTDWQWALIDDALGSNIDPFTRETLELVNLRPAS